MANTILLRDIIDDDLKIFFKQECDPVASLMAAYTSRDEVSFMSHWRNKILDDGTVVKKTVVFNESVAGSFVCWNQGDLWLVGYWFGREYWGKGIATTALQEFLRHIKRRPLHAYVANHNKASMKVLEKSGFKVAGHGTFFSKVHNRDLEETLYICN